MEERKCIAIKISKAKASTLILDLKPAHEESPKSPVRKYTKDGFAASSPNKQKTLLAME